MTPRRLKLPTCVALVVVAVVIGVTIRFSTFVPWGTDSAAYIASAHKWADGDLFSPATFVFWAPWSQEGAVEAPLGSTTGPTPGTLVGVYPLGYPLLLATALKLGGSLAPYLVAPLFAGLLAWCAYLLASALSGPWAGVMASVLIAATPVTLAHAIVPMSDVPAAALWALSWVLSLRPGLGAVFASGLAAALAIMVRPYVAPLAAVIAIVAMATTAGRAARWKRAAVFSSAAGVGAAMVLWSQAVLYGDPLKAGYGSFSAFFSADRILPNLVLYPRLLVEVHGWLVVAGLLMFPLTFLSAPDTPDRSRRGVIACAAAALILTNFALYLPYLTFEGWEWLRFMLPALLAIFVLFAASLDRMRQLVASRFGVLSVPVVLTVLAIVVLKPRAEGRRLLLDGPNQRRVQIMGDYLREAVPSNAVILTYLQSGAAAHYTRRPIVRLEMLDPSRLDEVVTDLSRRGYQPAFVLDEAMEGGAFRARFAGSNYQALEWPARAEFWSNTRVLYVVPADRLLFPNDEPFAVDVLRGASSTLSTHPMGMTTDLRSGPFPPTYESVAFRHELDEKYRNDLGRAAVPTYVDHRNSVVWMQRYLRYRLHACSHDEAVRRVLVQIGGRAVPPACSSRRSVAFPPRDELATFRRQLEGEYQRAPDRRSAMTHVDEEGEAVWMLEYWRQRAERCSHEQAATRVFGHIEGLAIPPGC